MGGVETAHICLTAERRTPDLIVANAKQMFLHSAAPCTVSGSCSEGVTPVLSMASLFTAPYYRAQSIMSNTLLMICKLNPRDMTECKNCRT